MSVVHRMLTDLDARHAERPPALIDQTFAQAAAVHAASMPGAQPMRRRSRVLLVLAFGAALTGLYLQTTHEPDAMPLPATGPWDDIDPPSAGVATALPSRPARGTGNAVPPPVQLAHVAERLSPVEPSRLREAAAEPASTTTAATPATTPAPSITATTAITAPLAAASAPATAQRVDIQPAAEAAPMAADATPGQIDKKLTALTPAQRAAAAYRQAMELAATGHTSLAIDKAQEALKADADHLAARQLAAALLFEKNRLEEAGALLRDGLARKPSQPQLVYLLARLKAETGDAAGALTTLAQTAQLSADGHGLRAVILARQGRYAEALPAYESAVRLAPENASWWLGLGVALDAEGHAAPARQALQRARAIGTLAPELLAFVDQKLAQ